MSRCDMSRVRWNTVATTADSPSRATIALHALSGLVWGASGGTACARAWWTCGAWDRVRVLSCTACGSCCFALVTSSVTTSAASVKWVFRPWRCCSFSWWLTSSSVTSSCLAIACGVPFGAWHSSLFLFTVVRCCWGIWFSFREKPQTYRWLDSHFLQISSWRVSMWSLESWFCPRATSSTASPPARANHKTPKSQRHSSRIRSRYCVSMICGAFDFSFGVSRILVLVGADFK